MNYASEDLIKEHKGILHGLKILDKMVLSLKSDQAIDENDLKEIVNFFVLFADKCHHGKEEVLMFPAMEKAGIPKENGPIGQMLLEHAEGRKYIAQMKTALETKPFDQNLFIQGAVNYNQLLQAHIEKENKVLFPMGDKKIPQEQQKKLLELFEEHEEKVMGPGTHEKLHAILRQFEKKYLS